MANQSVSRRVFVASGLAAGAFAALGALPFRAKRCHASWTTRADPGPHPTPRPGIDASHVLKAEQLHDAPDAIIAFDEVRQIPQIVDGIRCHCGCATEKGFYSLLSCYEGDGMARDCHICQGQGRMAFRLHATGKTLAEIRDAIDARYD
jgi:hypothetical protein